MNEKRFVSEYYGMEYYTEIVDNEKILDETLHNPSQKLTITELIDIMNEFVTECNQLKAKASSWKITCGQESNEKNILFMENRRLKEENKQLRDKLECCEYAHFMRELRKIHKKVEKGDLSDFNPLKEDKPLNDYKPDYQYNTFEEKNK